MIKRRKTTLGLLAASFLTSYFLFTSLSFGQEMPKPGEVIDKSNYKKYIHLFPEEFLGGFENGWDGIYNPKTISMKVVENKSYSLPKKFLALSEKNRGKYTLDKNGLIAGGYDYNGFPFPDVTKDDKDFCYKFMWNYNYLYYGDDLTALSMSQAKRKGEPLNWLTFDYTFINFTSRLYDDPKPTYKNPMDLYSTQLIYYTAPTNLKDMFYISYRYQDPLKNDDAFIYVPTMRRAIRQEGGMRFTPHPSTISATDDFSGFSGWIFEFTYKLLGEKKMLVQVNSNICLEQAKELTVGNELPWADDNYQIRDCYVIEITPKNPKYPQGKKVIYVDKELYIVYHSFAWDRSMKLWKVWFLSWGTRKLPDGETRYGYMSNMGNDIQMGYGSFFTFSKTLKVTGNNTKYSDITVSNLVKMAK